MATAVIALVLVVVVLAAALLGGAVVGSVAALDAAFAFDFFATRPYYSVRIDRAEDLETAVLLLVIGVVVGQLVTRSRLDRTAANTARSELERLHRVTELAAGGERPGRVIRVVREELLDVLQLADCEFQRPPFVDALPRLRRTGVSYPPPLEDLDAAGHDDEPDVELPVWADGLEVGRFVLRLPPGVTGLDLAPQARATAVALADQLGVILLAAAR